MRLLHTSIFLIFALSCSNVSVTARTPGGASVNIANLSSGTTRVYMTDDVISDNKIASLFVTINNLAVHTSATAGVNDTGWTAFQFSPLTFDLLTFTNNYNRMLSDLAIAAGTYQQIRVTVTNASITFVNGITADVTIPTGAIRLNLGVTIEADKSYGVMLDFVAGSSLVKSTTTPVTYTLNPVIQVKEVFTVNSDSTTTAVTHS